MAVVTAVRGPTRDYFRPIYRSSTDKIIPFEIPYLLLMKLRVKLNPFHIIQVSAKHYIKGLRPI